MPPRLTFLLVALASTAAGALETHGTIVVAPQSTDSSQDSSRNDIELRAQEGGFNAQGILRQQVADGQRPAYHGIANQFYYDGQITPGLGWTAGKKVLPWGVGFGFKPLDVIQREDRRSINPPPLVGVPLVALERLTDTDALTVAWTRPGQGKGETDNLDSSLALHWYRLVGGDDLHGVMRLSERRTLEAGFGATRVIGDEWAIHGAALYQRRGLMRAGGGYDGAAIKAVAGMQWTGESGTSVLVEAWDDADAPLATRTPRENLLVRLAWDDRDGFKPYADLQVTPRDGGRFYTVGASWEGNRSRLTLGLRHFGGAADSAYARAPIGRVIWAEWRLALF